MTAFQKKLWLGLGLIALLTPLGLILPELFESGDAWGEWGSETLGKLLGFIPAGLKRMAEIWRAPIADYSFSEAEMSMGRRLIFYLISGVMGMAIVGGVIYLISRFWIKHEK